MKKVIMQSGNTVDIKNVSNGCHYGAVIKSICVPCDTDKAFLMCRDEFEGEVYTVIAKDDFDKRNSYGYSGYLGPVIAQILEKGGEVFEFETCDELLKWLAE